MTTLLLVLMIILLLYLSYDDFKNKSVNAALTIVTVILAFILVFLLGINLQSFLLSCFILWLVVVIYWVFIRIWLGDIILIPAYVLLFYYVNSYYHLNNNTINGLIVLWFLLSIAVSSILNYVIYRNLLNRYAKKQNVTLSQITQEEKKQIIKQEYETITVPLLPVFTLVGFLFIIYSLLIQYNII